MGEAAWSLHLLRSLKTITLDDGIVLNWSYGQASALSSHTIAEGADIGNVTVTRDGKDVVHDVTFLFAFHAFLPKAPIYVECDAGGFKPKPPVVCYE